MSEPVAPLPNPTPENVRVLPVEFRQMFCGKHGSPLRRHWPRGYVVCCIEMLKALHMQPAFIAALMELHPPLPEGVEPDDEFRRRHTEAVGKIFGGCPACCWLPATTLIEIYTKAEIGIVAKCENCGRDAAGSGADRHNFWGRRIKTFTHACWDCQAVYW